ncbi:MAG: aldo/keto reductase [Opitutales bacterium]|nr:aldo/keto reductase [Opitutales bacterium]
MKYRRFGRTEINMPVISCGGMRYQDKWDDVPWDTIPEKGQKNIEAIMAYALENGINHIETARGYGSSEMQLGYALKQFPRESFILQTKVAPQKTQSEFLAIFDKSLNYLQQDYADLFALHGLNSEERIDFALRPGGCLEAALKLKEEGRIKHLGFSTHGSTKDIVKIINTGQFDYVNLHWYFTNQLNEAAIEAATQQDMGVFIISPSDKGGHLYKPPQKLVDLCAPLHPMAFNDLFCLADPRVHTLSCGAAEPSNFDIHIEAAEQLDDASATIAPALSRILEEVKKIGGPDWYDTWYHGIPDWNELPQKINVKDIVRLWTWAKAIDIVGFGRWRYNMMSEDDIWVPGNPVVDFDKTEMLTHLKGNPYSEKLIEILHESRELFAKKEANA